MVANSRKNGCGLMMRFWSSSVSLPLASSTRWITNITSGRPASYSSNTSAIGRCSAQGSRPSRNSVTCRPSLTTMASRPDEVDAADVAVEVDADQRPVEARGHLLDVGRLAGAVVALHHHAPVVAEAREDRQRGVRDRSGSCRRGRARIRCAARTRAHHVAVHAEVARRNFDVRPQGNEVVGSRHLMTPGGSTQTSICV